MNTEGCAKDRREPATGEPDGGAGAPNNRSTPGSAPTGEALTDEQEQVIYDALGDLAGIDTHDVNLRDNPKAWKVIERLCAALATHPALDQLRDQAGALGYALVCAYGDVTEAEPTKFATPAEAQPTHDDAAAERRSNSIFARSKRWPALVIQHIRNGGGR